MAGAPMLMTHSLRGKAVAPRDQHQRLTPISPVGGFWVRSSFADCCFLLELLQTAQLCKMSSNHAWQSKIGKQFKICFWRPTIVVGRNNS